MRGNAHLTQGFPALALRGPSRRRAQHHPVARDDIYDFRAAVATMHRILRPGGVCLVTVPGITPIRYGDSETWGEAWQYSFTRASMRRAFGDAFAGGTVEVGAHGNVVTAIAFQHGLAQQDLTRAELEHDDREHELVITVRAVKAP